MNTINFDVVNKCIFAIEFIVLYYDNTNIVFQNLDFSSKIKKKPQSSLLNPLKNPSDQTAQIIENIKKELSNVFSINTNAESMTNISNKCKLDRISEEVAASSLAPYNNEKHLFSKSLIVPNSNTDNIMKNESLILANLIRPRNFIQEHRKKMIKRSSSFNDKLNVKSFRDLLTLKQYPVTNINSLLKKYSLA